MKGAITLIVFLLLAFLVAGVGSDVARGAMVEWYPALRKPLLTPPDAALPVVWAIFYVGTSVAAWLAWREGWRAPETVKRALRLHFWQLLASMAWWVVLFGLRSPLGALPVVALMWYLTGRMATEYRAVSRPAWWLTLPCLVWIGVIAWLTIMIAWLNR